MMFVSSTETLINRNNKLRLISLYAAESAAEEARDRIKAFLSSGLLSLANPDKVVYITSSPAINPTAGNATSNVYFDSDYSLSFDTTMVPTELREVRFAWVRLVQKTERRAGYDLNGSGNLEATPVFFGYDRFQPNAKPTQYVNSGPNTTTHAGTPVYQITALARDISGFKQTVRADVSMIPQPLLTAALFSKDPVSVGANTVVVQGKDEAVAAAKDLNGLESNSLITGTLTNVQGSPVAERANSTSAYNLDGLIKALKPPRSKEIEKVAPTISKIPGGGYQGSGLNLGQPPLSGDTPQTVYAGGALTISNSSGQGILVVDGDLSVSGSFAYYGLIVVRGRVELNGSGMPGIEIHGAIIAGSPLADQTTTLAGNVTILNNSYFVQKQFVALPYIRLSHQELIR
jgi:hypothetical protein